MAKLLKLRLGVSDDPTALQPSLNDCLETMLAQTEGLVAEMLQSLVVGATTDGPRRIAGFQVAGVKMAVLGLSGQAKAVTATFRDELSRLVYQGGGKDQAHTEVLRFEDLQLFADEQLDQSIEVARAQQEVAAAVDKALPPLDALLSTMLGWRTIQPGLNPVRPDVYVRALQHTLQVHVPEDNVREKLITPAAGIMGVQLAKLYRELADWLRSTGVEPAVPVGGRLLKGAGASAGNPVNDAAAKTLLTLDRLRKLLAGDFDQPRGGQRDFLHTVPASMGLLQDMRKADELIERLERRPKPTAAPAAPVNMLEEKPAKETQAPRIGQQLGHEVVRLMFDNLAVDARLLPAFKRQLRAMEPAVQRLAQTDSRFFSDRNHAARQLLDRITQRSLAFSAETDAGWGEFMRSIEGAAKWLGGKVVDAEAFAELLDHLQAEWAGQDSQARQRREEAARALLHAEQRNLLAQKLGDEFEALLEGLDVADFLRDFLRGSWAQVVAEAQLSCEDGSTDPHGYRALVDDLIWSVQKTSAQRGRVRRLVQMIPGLLARLREGLARIGYPPELTQRFFDHLITLHRAAVLEGRDAEAEAAAEAAWAEDSQFTPEPGRDAVQMWLDQNEAKEAGYVSDDDIDLDFIAPPPTAKAPAPAARAPAPAKPAKPAAAPQAPPISEDERLQAEWDDAVRQQAEAEAQARAKPPADAAVAPVPQAAPPAAPQRPAPAAPAMAPVAAAAPAPVAVPAAPPAGAPPEPLRLDELRLGTWVELYIKGEWIRAQLTWSSPHATLFMFTSHAGAAHSMSRRTLDKLRAAGHVRVVADRPVVEEALDQVAQAALRNSLDKK